MLKIKSNTNEFIIIFSEKIEKKINAEKILCFSPLFLSASAPFLPFSPSAAAFFFSSVSAALSFLFFSTLFFSSSAQKCYIQPKTFLIFLQPKILFQFSPKISVQLQRLLLFCFFSSCLSFLPLATSYCPFSAQVFRSKPFSAASCLFI